MLTIAALRTAAMYHDAALPRSAATADPRPASAVSSGTGIAGLAGLLAWTALAKYLGMDGPYAALVNVVACGVPMVLWAVLVDKVHRNASTGMDWANPRPWRDTLDISLTRLAGLWLTFAGIALIYWVGRFYHEGLFSFSMWLLGLAAPWLFVASIPYVLWTDRHAVNPRDGTWHLGAWIMNLDEQVDRDAIYRHLRAWGVKAFFLPFMLGIVPGGFGDFIRTNVVESLSNPVLLANLLITFMFTIDVAFATVGYILTLRPLDSHIRTANPHASAWMAALICYPPFILMSDGGPLDYHPGTAEWSVWFASYPVLLWGTGAVLVLLTAIYAWATVAFGLRFSNLTHRGILTHGPYAFTRHPAYLSKNLFWWIAILPILTTAGDWTDAARATLLLSAVSGIYYWRARTEERHLSTDPTYREYSNWMERHAPIPRLFAWLTGRARHPMQPPV